MEKIAFCATFLEQKLNKQSDICKDKKNRSASLMQEGQMNYFASTDVFFYNFVIIFYRPRQMQPPNPSSLRICKSPQMKFSYLSPQHVNTVLFSPKRPQVRFQYRPQTTDTSTLRPTQSLATFSKMKSIESELDTTVDSLNDTPNRFNRQNCKKTTLCHSVIVPESRVPQFLKERALENRLPQNQNKNGSGFLMKKSCMPGTASQVSFEQSFRLYNQDKENCQFFRQFDKKQPLCFSKIKAGTKKCHQKIQNAKLQDFQIGQMLGKGSLGKVYMARHKQTLFHFALKKIFKTDIKDKEQFIFGVKCHFFLNGPHLVQLYACFSDQQCIYLLMDLCTDGNLAKYKKSIKNDEQRNKIILGVAKGLQSMHKHNVRHGDLKLQNVLICFGFPKITDLDCVYVGRSSSFVAQRNSCKLWGSPAYFSPSMITNSTFTLKDDIWALGVIMHEVFCKSHPFSLLGAQDLAKVVQKELPSLPSNMKQVSRKILEKMLSKNENERASLQQVVDYCHAILEKHSVFK